MTATVLRRHGNVSVRRAKVHLWRDKEQGTSEIFSRPSRRDTKAHSSGAPTTPLWACGATPCGGSGPSDSFLSRSEGLVHAEAAPTRFMVASGGGLSGLNTYIYMFK